MTLRKRPDLAFSDASLPFAPAPVQLPATREPTAFEQSVIAEARSKRPKPRPQLQLVRDEQGRAHLGPPHADAEGHSTAMAVALGSTSPAFQRTELKRLAACRLSQHRAPDEDDINTALAVVAAAEPQNEMEAALAVQMAAVHQVGMAAIARAAKTEFDPEQSGAHMRTATRAMRMYSEMLLALHKLRKKGDQHIRVEHLHLESGAQAIIANDVAGRRQDERE
jgi:hypothetical protein